MLLDTSGLLCLYHRAESFHDEACQLYRAGHSRLTHADILAEFIALAQARGLPRQGSLGFVEDLLANQDIDVVWVDEPLHRQAMALLHSRLDKSYSLCDAVSFVLMRVRKLSDALTTDRHFQEGFRKLLG